MPYSTTPSPHNHAGRRMNPIYFGVDIAGASNTWVCALAAEGEGLRLLRPPHTTTLERIVAYCAEEPVVAAAIDAQLSIGLSDENGFRASDRQLRALLPANCRTWVASFNSLMAVPVRGRLLAGYLAPLVGSLLETHPRASLLFGLGPDVLEDVRLYKSGPAGAAAAGRLWKRWCTRYHIRTDGYPTEGVCTDGALDALACATVAHLFHHAQVQLLRLGPDAPGAQGRGPFYVVQPSSGSVGDAALEG